MTFSVEITNADEVATSKHSVEIYIDKKSLESLLVRLGKLADESVGEDLHLMSESWGLGDLTEDTHRDENQVTHHLKIILSE